jgi:hypothetical protein
VLGSRDGLRVWLEGKEVLADGEGRGLKGGHAVPHKIAIDLKKGDNRLLVKVPSKRFASAAFSFACAGDAPPPEYELQEFVFDVEMANSPKPQRGRTRNRPMMLTAWDANALPFRQMLSMNDNNSGYSQPDPTGFDIESFEVEGPVWPPPSHARIVGTPPADGGETAHAREILARFMRRAWRRPIDKAELDALVAVYERHRAGMEFVAAVRESLVAVLTSPNFIFLVEPAAEGSATVALTDHELATRLSYFLWGTMPDEKLSRLADSGTLRDPSVLRRTVAEMLQDERVANFVRHFTLQWLKLDTVEKIAVDQGIYGGYRPDLVTDMVEETLHVVREVLDKNLPVTTLLDADFTFLNPRLAGHYGIPFPDDAKRAAGRFARVSLCDQPNRGGLMTHASVLLAGSDGRHSSPVRRGVWVLDRLLASPPPEPPPNVPVLNAASPNMANLTLKQKLIAHLNSPACASCHEKIDPFGVAFEHYDAVGKWHETSKRLGKVVEPVDAKTRLHDGTEFEGIPGLRTYLLTQKKDLFMEGVARYALCYALGRQLEFSDRPAVEKLTRTYGQEGGTLSALIQGIVASDLFQRK